ncbi:hypothetical protein C8J57DRAFT_1465460 [Mycena rebaudengoi]|nr:hypothetical protein C8J57DRAFT_1465460 [Mycena rebaudengoi]
MIAAELANLDRFQGNFLQDHTPAVHIPQFYDFFGTKTPNSHQEAKAFKHHSPPVSRRRTRARQPHGDDNTGAEPSPMRTRHWRYQEPPTPVQPTVQAAVASEAGSIYEHIQSHPYTTKGNCRAAPRQPVASSSWISPQDILKSVFVTYFDPDSDGERPVRHPNVRFQMDNEESFGPSRPRHRAQIPLLLRLRLCLRLATIVLMALLKQAPAVLPTSAPLVPTTHQLALGNHQQSTFGLSTAKCSRRTTASFAAKEAQPAVDDYWRRQGQQPSGSGTSQQKKGQRSFLHEAFVNALVEFIVGDHQSINVIENENLREIFLMLREDLKDSDIPHRTTIRTRILQLFDEYLDRLQEELNLRASLIGFICVPGHHNREHLTHAFLHVLDHIHITNKLLSAHCPPRMQGHLESHHGYRLRRQQHRQLRTSRCPAATFMDAIDRDPITTLHTIIRQIRSSSLRRQFFADILKTLKLKDLELLQDVITHWSSTLLMIERGLLLWLWINFYPATNSKISKNMS